MSITGRFEADFQSFYSAVDRADAKLADFQSGAGRVETALNRMVDSFSGRKIIQDATLAAEAVERIGGSGKLTEDELQRLATKASEAVAKMKAMGVEVPPQIQNLANQIKPVHEEMGFLGEQAADLGGKLVAAFAVERVVEFVLEIGKAQQVLSRLSKETQIDVEELQTLTAATQGYGLANDELAKALYNVSKGLQSGDDSVARGLHMIGLSVDEVRNKHGKELFLEIEGGLAKLQGSLRDAAAAEIYGSKLGASMAGFAKEANGAVEAADKLNSKLSKEEVEELARYADEVERLERNLVTLKDKILGGVAGAINSINDAHKNGLPWWKMAVAAAKDYFATMTGGVGVNLATQIEIANQAAQESAEAQERAAAAAAQQSAELSKEAQAIQFLTKLQTDAVKELEPYQTRGLEQLREMGQLNQQNAAAIGVSADQFKQYTENVRQAETATKTLTAASIDMGAQLAKIHSDIQTELTKQTGTRTEIELAEIQKREDAEILSINKRRDAQKAALEQAHADSADALAKIDADAARATDDVKASFDKLREGVGVDWDEIKSHSQAALSDIADRAMKTLIAALASNAPRAEIDKLTAAYRLAAQNATAMGQLATAAAEKGTDSTSKWNEQLRIQNEEYDKLKKAQEAISFSTDITAANFDQYTAPSDVSKGSILSLLKQGFSLQNAIDILRAQARGNPIDISKWPEDARGPRVPGFEGGVQNWPGGRAVVGEHGPEILDLPSGASVIPIRSQRDRFGGGGVYVHAPVYVSGVFDPGARRSLSNAVGDDIMRRVLSLRLA